MNIGGFIIVFLFGVGSIIFGKFTKLSDRFFKVYNLETLLPNKNTISKLWQNIFIYLGIFLIIVSLAILFGSNNIK